MDQLVDMLKVILFGIVEGLTEWLPVSSTGHLILLDSLFTLNQSKAFMEIFLVVIQLGAVMAIVVTHWNHLNPISIRSKAIIRWDKVSIWAKIIISCFPAAIIGFAFDNQISELFYNRQTVSITLILYGVFFILIEKWNTVRRNTIASFEQFSYKSAFIVGVFQVLSLVPGTSRSGATIIGALLIGASRPIATEFSFFLAIPMIIGASIYKLFKIGASFTLIESWILVEGMIVAFIFSLISVKILTTYVKRHDFKVFGWYRIILGLVVLIVMQP